MIYYVTSCKKASEAKWVNPSQIKKIKKNKSNCNHQYIRAYMTKILPYTLVVILNRNHYIIIRLFSVKGKVYM